MAQEAFAVIREALEKAGKIALGRIVIATRERILALEPRGKGILAYSLRSDAEVRKPDEIFGGIDAAKPDAAMIAIAEKIIEQRPRPFDPSQFVDRYEEALKALIAEKKKGHKPVSAEEPEDTNVIDLMDALRASLEGKGRPPAASKGKAPAKKAPAKKPAAHKTRKAS
jgi:DNA end-binding protein Ku